MAWKCQECDYLGEEIVETDEHDEGCPECGGYCIEFNEMTNEQECALDNFFVNNLNSFIKPYSDKELNNKEGYQHQLLWEDFEAAKEIANREGIFIYTVIDCEDEEAWLCEGWHFVNRIGYYFTTKKIEIPEEGLRYW